MVHIIWRNKRVELLKKKNTRWNHTQIRTHQKKHHRIKSVWAKSNPAQVSLGRVIKSAMTYFPAMQYHRRHELHCCVRDGNRCFLVPIVTDKSGGQLSPATGELVYVVVVMFSLKTSTVLQPGEINFHASQPLPH